MRNKKWMLMVVVFLVLPMSARDNPMNRGDTTTADKIADAFSQVGESLKQVGYVLDDSLSQAVSGLESAWGSVKDSCDREKMERLERQVAQMQEDLNAIDMAEITNEQKSALKKAKKSLKKLAKKIKKQLNSLE